MHRMQIQADGTQSENYSWHFVNLLLENMYGSAWKQLFFTHEETILNSITALLLKTRFTTIADFLDYTQSWIVGGTFALRSFIALKNTLEGTEARVTEARRNNLKDRFYKISKWITSASKEEDATSVYQKAAKLYKDLKQDVAYCMDSHSDITKLYVTTLFMQHLYAQTLKVIPLPRDGNGLFEAVSAWTAETSEALRQQAVDYILAHEEAFKPLIKAPEGETLDSAFTAYTDKLSQSGEPGDDLVITALSSLLNRPIIVLAEGFKPDFDSQGMIKLPDSSKSGKPIFILCQEVDANLKFYHALQLQGELYFEKQALENRNNPKKATHSPTKICPGTLPGSLFITPELKAWLAQSKKVIEGLTQPGTPPATTAKKQTGLPAQSLFAEKSAGSSRQTRSALTRRYHQMLLSKAGKSSEQKVGAGTGTNMPAETQMPSQDAISASVRDLPALPAKQEIMQDMVEKMDRSRARFFQLTGMSNTATVLQLIQKMNPG